MDRSGGYDPNRIPSKIFASKPTNPMEWSLASSESLFSLHIGNMNSFSTLNKSEELVRINEEFVMERKSTEIDTPEEKREVVMGKIETSSSPENVAVGHNSHELAGNNSTTISDHHIDDNMVVYTNGSFQFPILASNSGEAMESEKQETKKAIEPHSPISKTAPKPGGTRDWCHCFCFCSTCY
ncbi:pinin-like protein [Senna tora]|uniref:Pinin-like protein n=1 Tax=Senna tora TaxID=362788 RepID=A0A834WH12_9FABA|nr:pinin-like protein [Senna tora]